MATGNSNSCGKDGGGDDNGGMDNGQKQQSTK